jgi:hypothetical protein
MNNSTFQLSRIHYLAAVFFVILNLIAHSFSFPDAIYLKESDFITKQYKLC